MFFYSMGWFIHQFLNNMLPYQMQYDMIQLLYFCLFYKNIFGFEICLDYSLYVYKAKKILSVPPLVETPNAVDYPNKSLVIYIISPSIYLAALYVFKCNGL